MDLCLFQESSSGPRRPSPGGGSSEWRPPREPMFNAPWPALAIVGLIIGGYALQSRFLLESVVGTFAFAPANLLQGRWGTIVSALFVHGNWAHALTNGAFALAFGAPTARFFGPQARGVLAFFLFYLVCGVIGNLGFAAIHPGGLTPVVGASGAVSGLMAVAARLIAGQGRLGPIVSAPVLSMAGAVVVLNLLVGLLGGGMLLPGTGGAAIAWEAHLAGFAAGLLLVRPFAWLASAA